MFLAVLLLAVLLGCSPASTKTPPSPHTPSASSSAFFEDVSARAGVNFQHTNGASGRFYFVENTPAGCAFFDYDNDGFLDILLVQSGPSDPPSQTQQPTASSQHRCALYHNNGDGTFQNVTSKSGLDQDLGYGHGVAVGDYDNDGFDDLFITAYGGNHLFHNEAFRQPASEHSPPPTPERPLFREVTAAMGLDRLHSTGYATSAAWGDYDNDGRLDLYVCYYCPWTWAVDKPCKDANGNRDYCTPELYDPDTHVLYRNAGDRFVDVSERAGITKKRGRGLAVAWVDYNEDGRQDIFVANDLNAAFLWRNNGDGTFTEVATEAGCAYSEVGTAINGMGIGVADYDHSGRESLFVTNFSDKPNTLYRNMGGGVYEDMSMASGLALPHMKYLAWGCEFLDYDADGWRDLLVVNGHVQVHVEEQVSGVTYRERNQLFHNEGNGAFREITDPAQAGPLNVPMVSRGLAVGDYDNDGRLDALISNQNDPAQLLRNRVQNGNHWVAFKTIGTKSNRNGVHARFVIQAGGMRQTASVRGGSSYLSTSDRRVYFGLGAAEKIDRVEIRWPSGTVDVLKDVTVDKIHVVTEGRSVTGVME